MCACATRVYVCSDLDASVGKFSFNRIQLLAKKIFFFFSFPPKEMFDLVSMCVRVCVYP